jgi:hypothetical protein
MKTLMKVLIFFCFAFFLVVTSDTASSEEEPGLNPGLWLLSLYRDHISPVDGDRCPSIPSCSSYAERAFKKHGFFIGWMMTVDRLIHEGKEETSVSPFVYSEGKVKIFDPVENNDFWWYPRDGKRHE